VTHITALLAGAFLFINISDMKVIFIKDTPGQGRKGEIKEVSEGFASNFLIPKGFVQIATKQIQKQVIKEVREAQAKQSKTEAKSKALKQDLEKRTFTVRVKVGAKGQIFGGIKDKEVIDVINAKMNTQFDKTTLELPHSIKAIGMHQATIKLDQRTKAIITISIEPIS
jgi:large subunit ribosomal protein L9